MRELFVRPHAAKHKLFYGVNFELSVNANYWEPKRITSEVRLIAGAHLNRFDLIVNPILDTNYTGGFGSLEFVPATRAAYNFNQKWAFAAEEYADLGPLHDLRPLCEQSHQIWAVMDRKSSSVSIEAGIGVGVTASADRLTLKLMLSSDLRHQ